MSVRKRTWEKAGAQRKAWLVDYVDQHGKRHIKTFRTKREADAYHASVRIDVSRGTHTPESRSITVAEAAQLWLTSCENHNLERSTLTQYRQHIELHIVPYLGRVKLSQLSVPLVRDFEDALLNGKPAPGAAEGEARSPAMVRKIRTNLSSMIADAQERGLVSRNVIRKLRSGRKRGGERRADRRQKGKLRVGTDIPTRQEISAFLAAQNARWRPILLTAVFMALRASELRGLRWEDVDLSKNELHVRRRADRYNKIGKPKSAAGARTVPLIPYVVNVLREHKLASKTKDGLVFPNGKGKIDSLANIVGFGLKPAMIRAGKRAVVLTGFGNPTSGPPSAYPSLGRQRSVAMAAGTRLPT